MSFDKKDKDALYGILKSEIKKYRTCTFYLGFYGDFDSLCLRILKELKLTYPHIEIVFITPYLDADYQKLIYAKECFDEVIFPPLEKVPKKYAILRRNKWMVENADFLIAYVKYSWGGAAKTLEFAKQKKKKYINLPEL